MWSTCLLASASTKLICVDGERKSEEGQDMTKWLEVVQKKVWRVQSGSSCSQGEHNCILIKNNLIKSASRLT